MQYVHISDARTVVDAITTSLAGHLAAGERVAWLVSGGSAIEREVTIAEKLQSYDTSHLKVAVMDERYGEPGHKDENYTQLIDAGFSLPLHRVLTGKSAEKTASEFGTFIEVLLNDADFSLGFFGIGPDGHTAGIKPHSPAVTATEPTAYYEWEDYRRITITPPIIKQLDEAVIYAVGNQKAETLKALVHTDTPITDHPAQVLKTVKTATLYTDSLL